MLLYLNYLYFFLTVERKPYDKITSLKLSLIS